MNYPKLKTRPRSTHTVFRFGGLWHSDEAPVGMTNATTMRWKDLRNLGPDKYPMMSRIPDGTSAVEIDGCTIKRPLIAAAEGFLAIEHRVADALVVDVRPFVAACDDDRLVHPHPSIAGGE